MNSMNSILKYKFTHNTENCAFTEPFRRFEKLSHNTHYDGASTGTLIHRHNQRSNENDIFYLFFAVVVYVWLVRFWQEKKNESFSAWQKGTRLTAHTCYSLPSYISSSLGCQNVWVRLCENECVFRQPISAVWCTCICSIYLCARVVVFRHPVSRYRARHPTHSTSTWVDRDRPCVCV